MTNKLNFGQLHIGVSLKRRPGRPKKTLIRQTKKDIVFLKKVATDRRFTGHPVSRVLRRIFEKQKVRKIFGYNLTVFALLSGTLIPTASAFNYPGETISLNQNSVQITTENTVRVPVDSFTVSQNYSFFHRAIDLKEIIGAPVYPIMDGRVKAVINNRYDYGNHLIIDHGSGFESLYAHLFKIVVKAGEEVDKNTVLGTIGSTGFSTGPHLHLEVYDHGEAFNPLTILK